MDLSQPIPSNLRINSDTDHLYLRGLSHIPNGSEKRHFIYKPKVIFGVLVTHLLKNIVLITTSGDLNRQLVKVLVDLSYYLKMQFIGNVACIIFNLLGIASMIIYWLNYERGIAPTFLRVIDIICGQISPKDIGLTSEAQVVSLVRRADVMFKAIRVFVDRVAIIVIGIIYCVPGFQNSSLIGFFFYVIPNTIWYELFIHYCYNFLFYQMSYLYIMCSYLKMKIGSVDEEVKESIKQRRRSLMVIIKKLYDIFEEINEYNTTYWSKYLFAFWMTFGSVIVGCLCILINVSMSTLQTIVWSFTLFYMIEVFLVVILTTASVNSAINRFYCKCNSLFLRITNKRKGKQYLRFKIRTMIKVKFLMK